MKGKNEVINQQSPLAPPNNNQKDEEDFYSVLVGLEEFMDVENMEMAPETNSVTEESQVSETHSQSIIEKLLSPTHDDGLIEKIQFLQEKQTVLSKAVSVLGQEAIYEASQARISTASKDDTLPTHRTIWDQAKAILDPKRNFGSEEMLPPAPKRKKTESPRDPSIDISNVQSAQDTEFIARKRRDNVPTELKLSGGDWVTSALLQMAPGTWTVKADCDRETFDGHSLTGYLLPPPSSDIHGISLEEALKITSEPRCLAQASPPFVVVYANSAYSSVLVGLPATKAVPAHPTPVTVCPVMNKKSLVTHLLIRACGST